MLHGRTGGLRPQYSTVQYESESESRDRSESDIWCRVQDRLTRSGEVDPCGDELISDGEVNLV